MGEDKGPVERTQRCIMILSNFESLLEVLVLSDTSQDPVIDCQVGDAGEIVDICHFRVEVGGEREVERRDFGVDQAEEDHQES